MKFLLCRSPELRLRSHPTRGAWIEMLFKPLWEELLLRRTPHGVRGLK